MSKKTAIFLIFMIILLVIFLFTSVFVLYIQPKMVKNPDNNLKTTNLTQVPTTPYTANFQINGNNPKELKIILNNPPEKGITGMQIFLKINPSLKSKLKVTDIIETLPKSWQYVRKEFSTDNEIIIETIYLNYGNVGDTNKEFVFAKINLPSVNESAEISLDFDKSKLLGKQSGLEISFDNKLYSK